MLVLVLSCAADTVLMVTPMFHANSWGVSFSGECHLPVLICCLPKPNARSGAVYCNMPSLVCIQS